MKTLAPVVLFCYKRLDTLKLTIENLQQNFLAPESELFIFSDAAKTKDDEPLVSEIRHYLKTFEGFKKVTVTEAVENKGLARSIIGGVTDMLSKYDKVIVLEDDLVTSRNFLVYMNDGLNYYENNPKIFSVAGFSTPINIKGLKKNAVFFTKRADSCGWGTWKNRWEKIDWDVKDYSSFMQDRSAQRKFNEMGSDMTGLLKKQREGKINSWAIRWCFHQFKHDLYSVHPAVSKIQNVGFDSSHATHTKEKFNRFYTYLDNDPTLSTDFSVPVKLDKRIINQFTRPYKIYNRAWYKIVNAVLSKI